MMMVMTMMISNLLRGISVAHLDQNLSTMNGNGNFTLEAVAGQPAALVLNSAVNDDSAGQPVDGLHCSPDALTDSFGWFIQGVLASMAFALLIVKRFFEPRRYRRQWIIWFYDTSKQGVGAMVIHFANVFLSSRFQGDPCTWYIISFLLDSSAGLFVIFIGIRASQWLAKQNGWSAFNFGEYDKPQWKAWLGQCGVYVTIMSIEKVLITCLLRLDFWDEVRDIILFPVQDPRLELAIVVLVIPFVINAIMFWVVDNFLMRKRHKVKEDDVGGGTGDTSSRSKEDEEK